jgi:hypothetical protein
MIRLYQVRRLTPDGRVVGYVGHDYFFRWFAQRAADRRNAVCVHSVFDVRERYGR